MASQAWLSRSMFSWFFDVAACVKTSFFLVGEEHSIVGSYAVLFICLAVDGYLDCFHALAVVCNPGRQYTWEWNC